MIESQQPITSFTPPTQPLTMVSKAPVGAPPTGSSFGNSPYAPKEPKKIFGVDMRSALTVIGLVAFFILAMVGVLIALRQRTAPGDVSAPNAPLSEPQAAEDKKGSCSLSFTVAPVDTLTCSSPCSTDAQCTAVNPLFTCLKPQDDPAKGMCRLASNPNSAECKPATTTSACQEACTTDTDCADSNHTCFDTGASKVCRLRTNPTNLECKPPGVTTAACQEACTTDTDCADSNHTCFDTGAGKVCRLKTNPTNLECKPPVVTKSACQEACTANADCADSNHTCFNTGNGNVCRLATNTSSTTCSPATITKSACQGACTTNADCADSNHICFNTGNGNVCRLATNTSSTTCSAPVTENRTVGCQVACATNADCTDPDHICYATDAGNVCRLASNPTSTSCRVANTIGTTTTTTTDETTPTKGGTTAIGQPELPAELPQTGAGDIIKWLGPGIGALVLGALVLFFL